MSQSPKLPVQPPDRFQETIAYARPAKRISDGSSSSVSAVSDCHAAICFSESVGQPIAPKARDYIPIIPRPKPPSAAKSQAVQPQAAPLQTVTIVPSQDVAQLSVANSTATESPSKLSQFIRSFSPIIWALVIAIVIVPLAGRFVIAKSFIPAAGSISLHQELSVAMPAHLDRLDQAIVNAIQSAHQSARAYAESELNAWLVELNPRVDSFLDWYFDYFTQKKLEVSAPVIWLKAAAGKAIGIQKNTPSEAVNAQLTKSFQKEFTKRVLVPQVAQLRLEVITTAAAERFIVDLSQQVKQIQGKYKIPQGQWERYLDTFATTISDTEGNLSNLSLKTLVGGTGYWATKPLVLKSLGKVGSKISTKFTASATAKLAAKTGTSVAAELGTSLIDPIVGVGILIWDLWDYQHTVEIDRPLLQSNINNYLQSMERSLLDNPETGIMAAINQLEDSTSKRAQKRTA
jgi:hypothetical protein